MSKCAAPVLFPKTLREIKNKFKKEEEKVFLKAGKESYNNMSVFFSSAFLAAILALVGCTNQRRGPEASGRRFNRVQHGQCTYTFILPEQDGNCRESTTDQYNTNALQRDAPHVEQDFSSQKLQHLEHVMENYTQWLQKVSVSFFCFSLNDFFGGCLCCSKFSLVSVISNKD